MKAALMLATSLLVSRDQAISYFCGHPGAVLTNCLETKIQCIADDDCSIFCNEDNPCKDSLVQCPMNGNCDIECRGQQSCQNLIVNATTSKSGDLNVKCEDSSSSQCKNIKIYGSVLESNSDELNLICNGELQSCSQSEVHCPVNGDCFVSCNEVRSCQNSAFYGPKQGDLMVSCNAYQSCSETLIDAHLSYELELSGCRQSEACFDLNIYCPPNLNYSQNCFIQGNDNLRIAQLYAINGWYDIAMDYSGTFSSHFQLPQAHGIMHCGDHYETQCTISQTEWSCVNATNQCMLKEKTMPTTSSIGLLNSDDGHYDDSSYDADYTFDTKESDFEHGALGMLLIGGGLIALAVGCVICGTMRKAYHVATRKLSDMGFKSPFKSPRKAARNLQQEYRITPSNENIHSMIDNIEYSVDSASFYGGARIVRPESHTAHIHRPNSNSHTHTATINRPDSQSMHGGNGNGAQMKYNYSDSNLHRNSVPHQHQHQAPQRSVSSRQMPQTRARPHSIKNYHSSTTLHDIQKNNERAQRLSRHSSRGQPSYAVAREARISQISQQQLMANMAVHGHHGGVANNEHRRHSKRKVYHTEMAHIR